MPTAIAHVPTIHAARYLEQLCKHWSHKLDVRRTGEAGEVRFADGVARMAARAGSLDVTIEAADESVVERLMGVVATHLDRFAFREAPLAIAWIKAA